MNVIELQEVSKLYGFGDATTVALDNIDLEVKKGEFLAIMGPSGSGKSTLMNLIGLLDRPTSGSYQLSGKHVARLRPNKRAKARRDHIGFIFQNYNLLPKMTVIENVALPLAIRGTSNVRRLKNASALLEQLGLKEREYYLPTQLAGGQVQRVAIARALINQPSIILADEPTGNLDTANSETVMKLLSSIHKKGNTVLMVTHNSELTRYADRVIYLRDGRIEGDQILGHGEKVDISEFEKPKRKPRKRPKRKPRTAARKVADT